MRHGADIVSKYDLSSLRVLGSVGEPITPAAWHWYHDVVGGGNCALVDTYWQTETYVVIDAYYSSTFALLCCSIDRHCCVTVVAS